MSIVTQRCNSEAQLLHKAGSTDSVMSRKAHYTAW